LYVNADFDNRIYDAGSIKDEPWRFKILPAIGIELNDTDFCSIRQVLLDAIEDKVLSENRIKARDTAWQFRGHSGERIVDYLQGKVEELDK